MSTPGFAAQYSLYKSRINYCTAAGFAQVAGAILQELSLPVSVGVPLREVPLAPVGRTCNPVCHLDDMGACVRDCIYCTPNQPIDQCQEFTEPCPPSACCDPGQDACYAPPKPHFCCKDQNRPHCCNSEMNLCYGPGEQCCGDHLCAVSENCCTIPGAPAGCCPADQTCTLQGCCTQQNVPCGGQCCAMVLPPGADPACCTGQCINKKRDPNNCGRCGNVCQLPPTAPPHAAPICVDGHCQIACNDAAFPTKCGPTGAETCCPRGMDCCQNQCTDTMTDLNNCGRCGTDCTALAHDHPNSQPKCVKGNCHFDCLPGFIPCGGRCCSQDRCIDGVCCPSDRAVCNGVCCSPGQDCASEEGCCSRARGESQVCDSGRLCCPPTLPSAMGNVPVGCRNDQCTCLNGGTILNNACVGGGGGVEEVDVWNCFTGGVAVWVADQTTGTPRNKGAFPAPSGPCGQNPPDLTLSVQGGDFVSGHQYVVYAKDCDQNDPQFNSCVRASDGPFVADRNGTRIAFQIG